MSWYQLEVEADKWEELQKLIEEIQKLNSKQTKL